MTKAAFELFLEKVPYRSISYTSYEKQDEAAITHLQVGEVSAKIDAAELMLRRSVDEIEANAVSSTLMTVEQRARIRRDAGAASWAYLGSSVSARRGVGRFGCLRGEFSRPRPGVS
jgi:3-hydroxy-9,10-secoandrosta-1,3,5(10)-triene-9,17-dione monooxygenase